MPKPGGDPSSGISSGDVLILSERHPACRRREARPGSGMERENLSGDAKGKGASGSNREAENTDAPERGGLPRSSVETAVMAVERRGWVTAVEAGSTGDGTNPVFNGRRQPSSGGTSRMRRESQVRICGAASLAVVPAGESPASRRVQPLLQSYPATGLSR